ncbi:MAG: hypothetical protein JW909_03640 [Planctomycetes bacterium]|nr:hypothetical protein [Planctomycetota bacterium]
MRRAAAGLLCVLAAAGCGSGTAFMPLQTVSAAPVPVEAAAYAAADGAAGENALRISMDIGKTIPVPRAISYFLYEVGTSTGCNFAADWAGYDQPVEDSGSKAADEFVSKATGFGAGVSIIRLPYDGVDTYYGVRGSYTLGGPGGYVRADLELYSFFQTSLEWRDVVATVAYDYYINDSCSVGLDYSYKYYMNCYTLNFKYLVPVPRPLFMRVSLHRYEFDGSGMYAVKPALGLHWEFADDWFTGFQIDRNYYNGAWTDYEQALELTVGYRIKENMTAAVGIKNLRTSWLSDPETALSISYSQRF